METIDPVLLQRAGKGISQDTTAVIAGTGFYGIYVVLICVSLYSITRQAHWYKQRPSLILFATITVMFGLSTFLWSSNVALLWRRTRLVLLHTELGDLKTRLGLANSTTAKLRYMTDIMFIIEYLIGDALIGWRVSILHHLSPIIVGLLSIVWLGSAGSGVGLLVCYTRNEFAVNLPRSCKLWQNSSWTISLGFNLIAAILLVIIAWDRRKVVRAALKTRKTKVDRVLYILAGSGAAYFILGCMRLTLFANPSINPLPGPVSHANIILEFIFNQLVGIYPTLVTALVLNERTLFGSSLSSTYVGSSGPQLSQSIHFKTRETQQTDLQRDAGASTQHDTTDVHRPPSSLGKASDVEKAAEMPRF